MLWDAVYGPVYTRYPFPLLCLSSYLEWLRKAVEKCAVGVRVRLRPQGGHLVTDKLLVQLGRKGKGM